MKPVWFIAFIATVSLLIYSCSGRKDGLIYDYEPKAPYSSGKGGAATLNIYPIHRNINIDSGTILIKYNTLEVPTEAPYDDSVMVMEENGRYVARFTELKEGQYYLYARGWNNSTSEVVWGNLPLIVHDSMTNYTIEMQLQTR